MKILIADDDSLIRNAVRATLSRLGYEIYEAVDGNESLRMLEVHPDIQIVLQDWEMPGIQGVDICKRLRDEKNDVYILMLTGKGNDRDVITALEAGANDYLTKPFTTDMLRVRLLVGARYLSMRTTLEEKVEALEGSIAQREEVEKLFCAMVESHAGVSDLLFVSGKHPQVEVHGKLKSLQPPGWEEPLNPEKIKQLTDFLMSGLERLHVDLKENGSCDTGFAIPGFARFRVNIYKQNNTPAIVLRKLESQVPSIDMLKLPQIFRQIIKEKNGIVFLTGSTGSGKTTTLAAMLDELNKTADIHIVTLEDPIEFLHGPGKATFSQRQLGQDFRDFASGLRAALRQAPKAILVGEIRDRETMEIAMTASETGHLVFSTLHTINAGQSINRIIGMFSKEEENQIRQRLSETLRYVVSQRLVAKNGGGRLMVSEIMGSNLRTRETILYGESEGRSFQEIIEASSVNGWHTFDQSLLRAYEADLITEETAMLYCNSKSSMNHKIDKVKHMRGIGMDNPTNFRLERTEEPATAAPAPPASQAPQPSIPNLRIAG